jgi:hypothetical protein
MASISTRRPNDFGFPKRNPRRNRECLCGAARFDPPAFNKKGGRSRPGIIDVT